MDDVWKAIATGVGALLVGVLLHLLKEGGVRGMRRSALAADLELLDLLEEHPVHASRLRIRIAAMLEQYEPDPAATARAKRDRALRVTNAVSVTLGVIAFVALFDVRSTAASLAVGGTAGVLFNVIDWAITRRRDRAEQDRAVAQGSGAGTLEFSGSATGEAPVADDGEKPSSDQ